MAEQPLKKPPGYRDPNDSVPTGPRPGPKPVLPTTMYQKKKRRSCCRTCCCVFWCFLLILVLILIIAGGILYLWFDPTVPVFHLQSFKFPQFNVTTRSDGDYMDAATLARVEIKNPNGKLGMHYGKTHVDISLSDSVSDIRLGSDDLPGFTQAAKNVTILKVETGVSNVLVGPKVKPGFQSKTLRLNVKVRSSVGYIVSGWKAGSIGVNVKCGGVPLNRIMDGQMPKCHVNILEWITIH